METSKVNDGAQNAGHRRSLTSDSVSLRQSSPKAPAHFLGSHSSLSHVVLHRSIIDYVHPRSPKSSRRDSGQNMRPARTDRQRAQTVPLPGRCLGKHLRRHICPRGQFQVLTRSTFSTELLPLRSRKPPRKNQPTYLPHKIPPKARTPKTYNLGQNRTVRAHVYVLVVRWGELSIAGFVDEHGAHAFREIGFPPKLRANGVFVFQSHAQ